MGITAVDDYLDGAPEPHRGTLIRLRSNLREILPGAIETLSYNMPTFKVGGKAVAGYAYFRNHCSYFPHSGAVLPQLRDELTDYRWSKGTLQFPVDKTLPMPLVRRLVEVRLEELAL